MSESNDFLEAIQIIVDKMINRKASQIYSGRVTATDSTKKSCTMVINGKEYTNIIVYGTLPTVNSTYPVFAPQNNMSSAFVIVP